MKKSIGFLTIILLVFASCSSGDNPSQTGTGLLKRTVTNVFGAVTTHYYFYDGAKLDRITDQSGDYRKFTYTGNLITKIENFFSGNIPSGFKEMFEYNDAGQLVTYIQTYSGGITDYGFRETYVYNGDGTISITFYTGTSTNQSVVDDQGTVNFVDGEVASIITGNHGNRFYSYDIHKNPMMSVPGFGKLAFHSRNAAGISHNITSDMLSIFGIDQVKTTEYTYNEAGYPVMATETNVNEVAVTNYFYE